MNGVEMMVAKGMQPEKNILWMDLSFVLGVIAERQN